ncbi:hypothetical protein [Altererythrobacter fulvus]|uniref:hypothetical protein n=1 Tax=Caenibius fulvus TaxID=2126012 RepID=UPI003017EE31
MKSGFLLMSLLTSVGNCAGQPSEHQGLMSTIEEIVRLPEGARPIDDYSRNYAMGSDGKVIAVYVIPREPRESLWADGCEVALGDFKSRPCTKEEVAEMVREDAQGVAAFGKADESRWFDDPDALPYFTDGGCALIEIVFDPRSRKVESARCNGEA